ncbi:aspartyl protease family protein [Hufsiella ginkgonis]|uniref:Clan AA aspartic protease n=1 Tax=Hufsiella ginkgonis TaxID=2695274 RepID=A0A7K1Y1Q4_9SPHI|nr:aspartyl protease family protein [Hufsiella ginkgonis]MXV17164.1 clan AA aspartic protease [Hufsiella ginkgonis]
MRVPLEILNLNNDGFHLLVDVVVFGASFKAVVDTGASRTVFDKTLITGLLGGNDILVTTDKLSAGLGTTSMESFQLIVPEVRIGKFRIHELEAAVLDLSSINQAYANLRIGPVIGVIGGDILMTYRAVIDYGKSQLKFSRD